MGATWAILGSFHIGKCHLRWQKPTVAVPRAAQVHAITKSDELADTSRVAIIKSSH